MGEVGAYLTPPSPEPDGTVAGRHFGPVRDRMVAFAAVHAKTVADIPFAADSRVTGRTVTLWTTYNNKKELPFKFRKSSQVGV